MIRKITALLIVIAALLVFPKAVFGFGITPVEINVENIKPGGRYETEIFVTRPVAEANEELKVILELDLAGIESWFKFSPGSEFTFPTGKNTTSFKVTIDVPANADLRNYKGTILAKGESGKMASEGVTMVKAAVLGVNVIASDKDVYNLEVLTMDAPEVNSGDPVRLLLNIKNSGNVAVAPDKVTLEVMDLFEEPIESLSTTSLEKIDAFSTKEIWAEFNSDLEKGQYRIDAAVFFMDEKIAEKRMVLTVNEKPAGVGEEYTQMQPESSTITNWAILLSALVVFIFSLSVLIKVLRKGVAKDLSSDKMLNKFLRNKKVAALVFALVAVCAMAVAVYYLLLLSNSGKTAKVNQVPPVTTEEESMPVEEASPSSETEVMGVSVEEVKQASPLVVRQPVTPGMYPIYENPDLTSDIIYEAESGETFDVLGRNGDWYQVALESGISGWLHKTSIKTTN
jgi:hypothetical protein